MTSGAATLCSTALCCVKFNRDWAALVVATAAYKMKSIAVQLLQCIVALQHTAGWDHQTRIRPKAWVLPAQTSTGDTLAFHEDDDDAVCDDDDDDDEDVNEGIDEHNALITIFP